MTTSSESCNAALRRMSTVVDAEIMRALDSRQGKAVSPLYGMLRYFMGYADATFASIKTEGGKRFRPSLCLLLAEGYDAHDRTLAAAAAIELFHNFTLIHDDVEDHDEVRRNKPTVWKLWGINHAINSGDAHSLLASEWALYAAEQSGKTELGHALLTAFAEVIEGQYLDFELANASLDASNVNELGYLEMIEKKSGVLVRISAEAAGIAAGKNMEERGHLRDYGKYLGMAYQMGDDFRSVWTTQDVTGKDTYSDIREHKRTLPFLFAYADAAGETKDDLHRLYSLDRQLTDAEIQRVISIFNTTSSRGKVEDTIRKYVRRTKAAVGALDLPLETKALLEGIVDMLVPEGQGSGVATAEYSSIALT